MEETKYSFSYEGSKFWLILWLLLFFPVGLILAFTQGSLRAGGKTCCFKYSGSSFWLCFWTIFCLPIALLLLFVNGVVVTLKE